MSRKEEFERLHYELREAERKRIKEERQIKAAKQIYDKISTMNEYDLMHWLLDKVYFDEDYCRNEWQIYIDDEVYLDD